MSNGFEFPNTLLQSLPKLPPSFSQYDVNFAISAGLEYKFTRAKRLRKRQIGSPAGRKIAELAELAGLAELAEAHRNPQAIPADHLSRRSFRLLLYPKSCVRSARSGRIRFSLALIHSTARVSVGRASKCLQALIARGRRGRVQFPWRAERSPREGQ